MFSYSSDLAPLCHAVGYDAKRPAIRRGKSRTNTRLLQYKTSLNDFTAGGGRMLCRNVHNSALPAILINSMIVPTMHSAVFATSIARMGLPWENLPTYASAKTVHQRARQREKRHILCAIRILRQLNRRIGRSHCQQHQRLESIHHLDPLSIPQIPTELLHTSIPTSLQRPKQPCQRQWARLDRGLWRLLRFRRQVELPRPLFQQRISHQPSQLASQLRPWER